MGFPGGSAGKESICNVRLGSVPGLGRSPGEGNSYPLLYSDLENFMDFTVTKTLGHKESDMIERLSLKQILYKLCIICS